MFARALTWLKWIFGIVPKSAVGSPVVFRAIHYTLVGLTALILGIFSNSVLELIGAPKMDHGPGFEWIDRFWCGFVFLLGYAIIRVVLHLLSLMGIEEEGEFKDIDNPWNRALADLDAEDLQIDDLPLFIINGLTPQQEQSVFQEAANLEWKVISPPPNDSSSPLRVFANSDAIFVSCTGIGAVSCQQGKVVTDSFAPSGAFGGTMPPKMGAGNRTQTAGEMGSILAAARASTGTMVGGAEHAPPSAADGGAPPPPIPAAAGGTLRSIGAALAQATMSPGGVKRAMKTFSAANAEVKGYGKKRVAPINEVEAELGRRRVDYLCSLIREARFPYCPINGMMQVIPLSWATAEDEAKRLAPAIQHDLAAFHESLQLQFPIVVVFSELDSISGLKEFLVRSERLQRGIRNTRAGTRFWPGSPINHESIDVMLDRSMNWFRGWIYAAFSQDINSEENQSLFHLLCAMRQKKPALATLLKGGLSQVCDPEMRLSGCYFAATGPGATEQGFVRGVLDRLVEMEEEVAWSPELSHSRARKAQLAKLLIGGTVALAAANAFILYQLLQRGDS